jgi:hypothetical protein
VNPLLGNGDTEAVDRLHEAVKKLNRGPRRLLRFVSDSAGLGILWEPVGDPGASALRPRMSPLPDSSDKMRPLARCSCMPTSRTTGEAPETPPDRSTMAF